MDEIRENNRNFCYLKCSISIHGEMRFTFRAYDQPETGNEYDVELDRVIIWSRYGYYTFEKEKVRGEGYNDFTFTLAGIEGVGDYLISVSFELSGRVLLRGSQLDFNFNFNDNYDGYNPR